MEKKIKITELELLETRYDAGFWTWFWLWLTIGIVNFISWTLLGFDIFFSKFTTIGSIIIWLFVWIVGVELIYLVHLYQKYILTCED